MRIIISAILLAAAAAGLYAAGKPEKAAPSGLDRANSVTFSFYRKAAAKDGNVFFSPLSMYSAFAMVYDGARGKTASEIRGVFAFPDKPEALRQEAGVIRGALDKAAAGSEFVQANAFWYQKDYSFLPEYTAALGSSYKAAASPADFKTDPEAARKEVNSWAESRTKGRIKDLFAPNSLNALTRLVLANAVYFKGAWARTFDKERTYDGDFKLAGGGKARARLMTADKVRHAYYETDQFQAAGFAYAGGTLRMLALLPRQGKKLDELEKTFDAKKLAEVRAALRPREINVTLPRFKFASDWDLGLKLPALGMPTAFTDAADFSGMDGKKDLYIQKAVQKAFVEVNEEGTEAAAATGVAMGLKSIAFDEPPDFRADRPFLFLIEDAASGLVLFMGRVSDPTRD